MLFDAYGMQRFESEKKSFLPARAENAADTDRIQPAVLAQNDRCGRVAVYLSDCVAQPIVVKNNPPLAPGCDFFDIRFDYGGWRIESGQHLLTGRQLDAWRRLGESVRQSFVDAIVDRDPAFDEGDLHLIGGIETHVEGGADRNDPLVSRFDDKRAGRVFFDFEKRLSAQELKTAFAGRKLDAQPRIGVEGDFRSVGQGDCGALSDLCSIDRCPLGKPGGAFGDRVFKDGVFGRKCQRRYKCGDGDQDYRCGDAGKPCPNVAPDAPVVTCAA